MFVTVLKFQCVYTYATYKKSSVISTCSPSLVLNINLYTQAILLIFF